MRYCIKSPSIIFTLFSFSFSSSLLLRLRLLISVILGYYNTYSTFCFLFTLFDLIYHQRMKHAGVFLTTSESMILSLAGGSDHPQFKALQKIIMTEAAETKLLQNISL